MSDPTLPPSQPTPPTEPPTAPPAPPAQPQPAYSTGAPDAPVPGKTLGIVALILAFFFQLIALILGIVAFVQSRKAGVKNTPALIAIILSVVFGIIWIIVGIGLITAGLAIGGSATEIYEACVANPTGTVEFQGQTIDCSDIITE